MSFPSESPVKSQTKTRPEDSLDELEPHEHIHDPGRSQGRVLVVNMPGEGFGAHTSYPDAPPPYYPDYKPLPETLPLTHAQAMDLLKSKAPKEIRDLLVRKFYAIRPGTFEHAVDDIKRHINAATEGTVLSAWLLAELDLWDHEKERVVIITDRMLLVFKYNFVALRIEECRRVQLQRVEQIATGTFKYPKQTLAVPRFYQTGLRVSWDRRRVLSRWERFSPFFKDPPFVTLIVHKAAHLLDAIPEHMQFDRFKEELVVAAQRCGAHFESLTQPIEIEVYVGAVSTVHNSSDLGFSKDRGAASF